MKYPPQSGWRNNTLIAVVTVFFLAVILLLTVLTRVWLVSKENKNRFQILAHTDSLTDIYNRYGFDEAAEKIIAQNPKTHFVAALFDIDDFKFINDVYGHAYGDRALKSLADNMKAFFHQMYCLEETVVTSSVFFFQIIPVKKQKNYYSNSPDFQRHSHIWGKNILFIFLLDMQNIRHLLPTVHSSCAVQIPPFTK